MSDFLWNMFDNQVLDGKYHIRKRLGVGGYGAVFLADEVVSDNTIREVVIKLFQVSKQERRRQMRELVASATLNHAHLIRCFSPGSFTHTIQDHPIDMLYIVMERADESLEQRLRRGPLTLEEADTLLRQMTSALDYLHRQPEHWVHRDVKPANILYCNGVWKLADFGLLRDANMTAASTTVVGTPGYVPPEAFRNQVSPAWDIWSLGVVLVEALTGKQPFAGESIERLINAILNSPPSNLQRLPEPFITIANGCLEKDPRKRINLIQILHLLDHPPIPVIERPAIFKVGLASLAAGAGALLLRALSVLLIPQASRWFTAPFALRIESLWNWLLLTAQVPPLSHGIGGAALLGFLLFLLFFFGIFQSVGSHKLRQAVLLILSFFVSVALLLGIAGGIVYFYAPSVLSTTFHSDANTGILTVLQQASTQGMRIGVWLLTFPAIFSILFFDTLGLTLHLPPALAWGVQGALIGGYVMSKTMLRTDPTRKEPRLYSRILMAAMTALLLFAPLTQKSILQQSDFLRDQTWNEQSNQFTSEGIRLIGNWKGNLQNQNVILVVSSVQENNFQGILKSGSGRQIAHVDGKFFPQDREVTLRLTSSNPGKAFPRLFIGMLGDSMKQITGGDKRIGTWSLSREDSS